MLLICLTNTDVQQKNTVLDFNFIYNKYCNNVWITICKSIFDAQQREEVMQDVFVKFYKIPTRECSSQMVNARN